MLHVRGFRLLCFVLAALIAGPACQCLEPVSENAGPSLDAGTADAGVDAGSDSGIDAGTDAGFDAGVELDAGAECVTAADCRGTPWASQCFGVTPGFSCVVNRCVSDCVLAPDSTCTFDAGAECLDCTGAPSICIADTCSTSAFDGRVSLMQCRPGFTPPLQDDEVLSFVPVRGASCEYTVSTSRGGLGQAVRGLRGPGYWFVRSLGGYCIAEELPTGAIRSAVACPFCTFTVEGF